MNADEILARLETRKDANKKLEEDAERQLVGLQHKLRELATHNAFALECWRYYVNNYCGRKFKSAIFSCNYLKDALSGIEQ